MILDSDFPLILEKAFITSTFPIQNTFSIFPKETFRLNTKNEIINYKDIQDFCKNLIYEKISSKNEKILNNYFKKDEFNNQYFILGYFNKKFEVTKFCIWYNHKNKEIYFKNNEKENKIKLALSFDNNISNEFILIALRYCYEFKE